MVKSVFLIILLIGIVVIYLIYGDRLFNLNTKKVENPLSCILKTTSEITVMGQTTVDEYRYERNITFDKNDNVDTIEFIGNLKVDPNNSSYEDAKNNTWTPDLITSDCEEYGMNVNTTFNDKTREIKSICSGNYDTITWQDSWKSIIGTTREEIKNYYISQDYECN